MHLYHYHYLKKHTFVCERYVFSISNLYSYFKILPFLSNLQTTVTAFLSLFYIWNVNNFSKLSTKSDNFIISSQNRHSIILLCKPDFFPTFLWIMWITSCITQFFLFFRFCIVDNFFAIHTHLVSFPFSFFTICAHCIDCAFCPIPSFFAIILRFGVQYWENHVPSLSGRM